MLTEQLSPQSRAFVKTAEQIARGVVESLAASIPAAYGGLGLGIDNGDPHRREPHHSGWPVSPSLWRSQPHPGRGKGMAAAGRARGAGRLADAGPAPHGL